MGGRESSPNLFLNLVGYLILFGGEIRDE